MAQEGVQGQRENPLRAEKRNKLRQLRELGVDPYPHTYERTHFAKDVIERGAPLEPGGKLEGQSVSLAGRLMTKRPMGKAAFFNIQDQSGNVQVYLRKQELSQQQVDVFELSDIGDIVGIKGFVFKTGKGEPTIHVTDYTMLCKSIEPLPEKFHGIADIETKYRFRHLDLITDPDSREVFRIRSKIISEVRRFLDGRGFMEVETPVLQPIYGGASAYPFSTHHRALDMTLFMKISPELYLKRLIVGGFEKVYEINKNFRNEGIDRTHNPEFTMLEFYEAYTDYQYQMTQFEDLIAHLCLSVKGTVKFEFQGKEIDFTTPWRRLSVYDGLKEYAHLDVSQKTAVELFEIARTNGSEMKQAGSHGEMVMELFGLLVEKHLWHPTFVIDFPQEVSPLTKSHRLHKGLVERFEPIAAGMEIGNAYTELNDPEDQLARLKAQEAKRVVDEEAQPMDDVFIHAIDVGMPPTGGVGIGMERIIMLLTNQASIRDILLFPTMKSLT